jgi:phosphohistidine phosphatase
VRRLFVLRHAKSSWDDPSLSDRERPLTPRGVRAAARMADLLADHADPPTVALCSDARRALDTLAAVRRRLPLRCEVAAGLHLCDARVIAQHVAALDPAAHAALVIGHNPGLHDFVRTLAGRGRRPLRRRLDERFPTAALAELELGGAAWSDLAPGSARLVELVFPRDLA